MNAKKYICYYCKEKFDIEELIQENTSRRVCKVCDKNNEEVKVKNKNDYAVLIEYICLGFGQKSPTGKQLKHIKEFRNMGYTYVEIQWTIYYISCIIGKKMDGNLSLVPFYYLQAKNYFESIEKVEKSVEEATKQAEEIVIIKTGKPKIINRNMTRYVKIEDIL